MDFLTREVFDALIIAVILVGLALAAVRLYQDFSRPLPGPIPGQEARSTHETGAGTPTPGDDTPGDTTP